MEVLLTNNVPIFIGAAGALIVVSGMILSSILMIHLWEGLMPYSLLLSILLGVLVIISQSGVFESRFVVDDALASALILLQLILSVLYPLDITKKFESEPGAIFYR
jgi:hypothetical protein